MTRLWDVQAAVKALLTGAVDVPVYDAGSLIGDDALAFVTVGEAGENGTTASSDLSDSSLSGDGWQDETGEIPCVVECWNGGTDIAPLRASAKPLLAACTAAVRADPTLGGLLARPGAQVVSVRLREGQTDRGALVQAAFTVRFTTLLT